MPDYINQLIQFREASSLHLKEELLPFWLDRYKDQINGDFITHFNKDRKDTGSDEKSTLRQARDVYSFSAAHRTGYGEGSHSGGGYDRDKEFWQNAEMLIALLQACIVFGPEKNLPVYENVHRFVFDKVINNSVGEWASLLTRQGEPIWEHEP